MNKKVMKLASKGKRLGAYCIDEIVPAILTVVMLSSIALMYSRSSIVMYGDGYGYNFNGGSIGSSLFAFVIALFIYMLYLVVQIVFYTKGQTIGKAMLGMRVVSSRNGETVSVWNMILREWFAKKASEVVFCLGFIWILIDEKNRAWHDKIMDTYVIDIAETNAMQEPKIEKIEVVEVVPEETPQSIPEEAAVEENLQSDADEVATVQNDNKIIDDDLTGNDGE